MKNCIYIENKQFPIKHKMKRIPNVDFILPVFILCFLQIIVTGKAENELQKCISHCKRSIFSPKHVREVKSCLIKCLEKVCDESKGFQVQCKCINEDESLNVHCSYCCQAPKSLSLDIKTCSDGWNEERDEKTCDYFKTSDSCPDCGSCYKNLDSSHCNDLTKISSCLYAKVNQFGRTKSCINTYVNCKCIQDSKDENVIECFWGCENIDSGDWTYYATPQFQNYITNHTNGADDGGTICPGCPSCMDDGETVKDTENCLKDKLDEKFMQYEAHCYCMDNENGETQKKCMWRGIELQCGRNSDSNCMRQIVGSYGVPRYFLNVSHVVDCKNLDALKSTQPSIRINSFLGFLHMTYFILYF